MIVYFMCDCCDTVFDDVETEDDALPEELGALTGYRIGSIINNGNQLTELYISSTCEDCMKTLMGDENVDFSFLRSVIN